MDPTGDLEMGPQPPQVDAAEPAPDENRSKINQTTQDPTIDDTESNNSNDQNAIFESAKICVLDIDKTSDAEHSYRETLHEEVDRFEEGLESRKHALGTNEAQQVLIINVEYDFTQPNILRECIKKYLRQRQVSQELIDQFLSWSSLRTSWLPPIGQRQSNRCFHSNWMRITTDQAHCDEEEFMRKFNSPSCFGFPGYKSRGDGSKIFKIAKRRNMDCLLLPQTTLVIVNGFKNETLQSFVANVRRVNLLTGPGKPLHEFLRLDFCRTILHNERMVLGYLEEALRTIDFDLGGKGNHKEWSLWQSLLGFYRPHLHSSHAVKRRLYRTIKIMIQEARPDENTQALEKNFQALKEDCAEFATHLEDVLRHVESTSNALTGSLSIMESRKAIKEAEEVTKLTQLAFFFIPLTFVAGIFGMNFKEMADLSIWIWAVTSVVLLLASYFVLFTSEIRGVIERSKNMIAVVEGLMLARALRN